MANIWLYVGIALFFVILTFVMTPPTWLVDQLIGRFTRHPALKEEEVTSIHIGEREVTGDNRRQLITDFNEALLLNQQSVESEVHRGDAIVIETKRLGHGERYLLHDMGARIQVVKERGKKRIVYHLESQDLRRWFVHGMDLGDAAGS